MVAKNAKSKKRRANAKPTARSRQLALARRFLHNDPRGQRLRAAEHVLTLLANGELPMLKRYVLEAAFDLRKVMNAEEFASTLRSDPHIEELIRRSQSSAFMRIHFADDSLRFVLFHENDLGDGDATLFAESFRRIIEWTYTSLGLDLKGRAPTPSERARISRK